MSCVPYPLAQTNDSCTDFFNQRDSRAASVLQEKLANKLKKEADEKKFKFAKVDGRTEQVEPPPFTLLPCCNSKRAMLVMSARLDISPQGSFLTLPPKCWLTAVCTLLLLVVCLEVYE